MKTILLVALVCSFSVACAEEGPTPDRGAAVEEPSTTEPAAARKVVPPVLSGSSVTYVKEARAKAAAGDAEGATAVLQELLSLTGNTEE